MDDTPKKKRGSTPVVRAIGFVIAATIGVVSGIAMLVLLSPAALPRFYALLP
jgi:hypothetical protein